MQAFCDCPLPICCVSASAVTSTSYSANNPPPGAFRETQAQPQSSPTATPAEGCFDEEQVKLFPKNTGLPC